MLQLAKALGPQEAMKFADLIVKNMDWPGAEQIATRLARFLPPNVLAPEMKDVPPQVQAFISALQKQLQAMMMERQKLTMALTDKRTDQALVKEKIEKDFEAKLLAIMQKADAAGDPVDKFATLATGVHTLMMALETTEPKKDAENA
jgi:hypothetical protein